MNNYRVWDIDKKYGDLFCDRAIGKLPEMECSKALCKILKPIYKSGMKVLDVGCGGGHYLKSLKDRLDNNINYTGVDATEYYIKLANDVFSSYHFEVGDIHKLQFVDNSFDIVMCNNVIQHLPPPPKKAISELLRTSSKYVVFRTLFAKRNYIIKEVKDTSDGLNDSFDLTNPFDYKGNPVVWNYMNLYTEEYLENIILGINPDYNITFVPDNFWNELETKADSKTATEVVEGKQVSGNIILDWKFIIVEK